MAVIAKFFVVRNGVELDKVFTEKKDAETYDIMLDAAEQLAEFIKKRPPRRAETKPISNGCPPTFFEYTFAIKGGAK